MPRPVWSYSETEQEYVGKIAAIRQSIADGTTYQVNYTFRCHAPIEPSTNPWSLFLKTAGSAPYATYLDTGRFVVSSASPELFFERIGKRLIMKPMKGTAARGLSAVDDLCCGEDLRSSKKNRAENLMIVDMIRNDVGRIAKTGSVEVEKLFELERYPTLWQMTSTVAAESSATLAETFSALFPCASITGAPKVETMRIIEQLEGSPRGLYTGAIGVLYPDGDAKFSVAIRTALFDRQKQSIEYGVGSGIVWDSVAVDEYQECMLKTQVVKKVTVEPFSLLETIRYDSGNGSDDGFT